MRPTTLLVGLAVVFAAGVAFAQNNSTPRQGIGAGGASIGAADAAGGSVSSGGETSNARGDVSPMGAGATAGGGSTQLFAVVNEDGTTARGKGDMGSEGAGGFYRVFFARNVRNCAYTATIGLTGATSISPPGFITVVGDSFATNGVFLTTHDVTGESAPRSFHLYVDC